MGYSATIMESSFFIDNTDKNKAMEILLKLNESHPKLKWIDYEDLSDCTTFENTISEFGWLVEPDENGNIVDIEMDWEKIGDELIFFDAIAPVVKSGSYIQMSGEDGQIWRWAFDGKNCKEIFPKIIWE